MWIDVSESCDVSESDQESGSKKSNFEKVCDSKEMSA